MHQEQLRKPQVTDSRYRLRGALVCAALLSVMAPRGLVGQEAPLVIRGGHLFDGTGDTLVANTGIIIVAGKFFQVGADLAGLHISAENVVELTDDDFILPGLFDLHAHYAVDLFGRGRVDDTTAYPVIFLANGVTSTFPAGEVSPHRMRRLRLRIDRGEAVGPRIFSSGPYFGSWRQGWNRDATAQDIYREVDSLAAAGIAGFKAKGITPAHLRALIMRAHLHGLTVTGHLGSGFRNTVNPREAIMMGIDRVEHFLGGDAMPTTQSAYASLEVLDPTTGAIDSIIALYRRHHVYFDATLTAYGYFGARDPEVFTYFADEPALFTPYARERIAERLPREVLDQFERIYWVKRRTLKAFYDAGGGDLITLGTDHPSWGEFLSGFGVHREMHAMVLSGLPPAAVLRIATINGARALGAGDRLGTIEPGKLADLVIIHGNPLADIRNTRHARLVVKAGVLYDARELLQSVLGTIGPHGPDEVEAWVAR